MYIEDKELRDLFKAESEEHLQSLDNGLLKLEANPGDQETLDEVFRDAHSLKGAARMLGIVEVESIAHHLEDILGKAKAGKLDLSSDIVDKIYFGIDCIRKLVVEAVEGEKAGIDYQQVLEKLKSELNPTPKEEKPKKKSKKKSSPKKKAKTKVKKEETLPEEKLVPSPVIQEEIVEPELSEESTEIIEEFPSEQVSESYSESQVIMESSSAPVKKYHIDTIRVDPQKLDGLMTQAGELTVTKIRISRRLSEIEELVSVWEEWSRDIFNTRMLMRELERNEELNGLKHKLTSYFNTELFRIEKLGEHLKQLQGAAAEDNARLELIANKMEEGIRSVRLLPLSTIFNLFPRMVRDLAKQEKKNIRLVMEGEDTTADKYILEEMKDPLMHMIRNAIDHGIESPAEREKIGKPHVASIWLRSYQTAQNIIIEVIDDGCGLDVERIKAKAIEKRIVSPEDAKLMTIEQVHSLIFASGFSTSTMITDVSGRGVGMDVVKTNIEQLKGTIVVESQPNIGTTFRVQLPITMATTRVLIVWVEGRVYAIPVEFVETSILIRESEIFSLEGKDTITFHGQPVSIAYLSDLLEINYEIANQTRNLEDKDKRISGLPCIIVSIGDERLGVVVDALIDEQEVVLKPLGGVLKRVRNVSSATILGTGEVCIILNPADLIRSVKTKIATVKSRQISQQETVSQKILLVEDSITTRTQEKRILEAGGYQVVTAIDGVDAYSKLTSQAFDAIVSDIEMPNMDGFEFTEKVRAHQNYKDTPLILVTSLASDEHKRKGLEVGANAYITKGGFDQKVLLDTIKRLI